MNLFLFMGILLIFILIVVSVLVNGIKLIITHKTMQNEMKYFYCKYIDSLNNEDLQNMFKNLSNGDKYTKK